MTDFYADYITKTTFDPDTHSVKTKLEEAATDTKKKPASKTPKVEVEPTIVPEEKMRKCPITGKMIPVGEELHGDQHKLDHNKDNKIDKADMKMVRKKGAVSEDDEQLEEGTFKVQVEGLPMMYIEGGSAGTIKSQLRKKFKDPDAVVSIERITSAEKKKELRAKVSEGMYKDLDTEKSEPKPRPASVVKAAFKKRRGMNEDQAAMDAYLKKGGKITKVPAAKAQGYHGKDDLGTGQHGMLNKSDTSSMPTRKKVKSMEDVENVSELDKSTMASYTKKAVNDVDNRSFTQGMRDNNPTHTDADRKNNRMIANRRKGISRAVNKMSSEGFANAAQQAAVMAKLKKDGKYKGESVKEEYGEGEKNHITSHVEKKYGGRGGPGGSGVMHVGSHGHHHAYNTEPEHHTDTHNSYAIHHAKTGKTHEIKLPPKAHTAAQVHKHIKPHGGSANLAKHIANDHNSMHESSDIIEKDTHVTKDGKTAKKGLWYNIHKKRARGEAPAKPGDPDRPSAADLKRSQNEDTLDEGPFNAVGKFMMKRKMQKKMDSANKKMNYHSSQSAKMKSDQMNHVNARSKAGNEFQRANKIKDRLSR